MKISRRQLRRIIKENINEDVQFKWSRDGLVMFMMVDGQTAMQFSTQSQVRALITQLEELLAGPMRSSP